MKDPDSTPAQRDELRHELSAPLSAITARGQLLQRRLLRADGLANLERDLMLGDLATMLAELQRLGNQIETLIAPETRAPSTTSRRIPLSQRR